MPASFRASADDISRADAPLLAADDLGRRVPGSDAWLFRHLSLTIPAGARLAIVGRTGSGKTLLLRALALLDPLDEGTLAWRGQAIAAAAVPAYRAQVIYLHQRPALFPGSVRDNLQQPFTLAAHRHRRYEAERVLTLLRAVGRDDAFLQKEHRDLSGGERQIVALIRALQLEPDLLLLDEPTAALDADTTAAIESLLDGWLAEDPRRGTVWVSHNASQVERVARRVLHLNQGQLQEA